MLARRQELNTQLQVFIDAFLLALSLWAAYVLRYYGTFWFNLSNQIDPQRNYAWLLIVIMPFGPILLDMQGFYQSPLNKTQWKSVIQIGRAMIGLSIIVSACVIFLRLPLASRSVPLLFILIGTLVLLAKERLIARHLRRKAMRGELREPVLLAGLPQDIAALEQSFTAEQQLLINVVGRIDIDRQPISDLIEAMHRHAVARVIFAAGHSQLNRVEQAIGACEIEGVPAWLVADFIQTSIAKPDFDAFAGRPMLVFRSTPEVSWALLVKGIIDRGGVYCTGHLCNSDGYRGVAYQDYVERAGDFPATPRRPFRQGFCDVQIPFHDRRRGNAAHGAGTVQSNAGTGFQSGI